MEHKVASNERRARVISSGRLQRVARIEQPAGAAPTVQGEAVLIGPAAEADSAIWTARPRTGRVVTFRASGSRAFRAAALTGSVAVVDLTVIDSVVVVGDLEAAALAALADSAVVAAGSGAGDEN
jgi:hypothetical protein